MGIIMSTKNIDTLGAKGKNAVGLLCPVCSSPMYESDRLHEGQYSFVWFECSKHGCNGQWLSRSKVAENKAKERVLTA